MKCDVLVIGGGPAGMAAAIAADKAGCDVLMLERADESGGILTQCIHNGFGLHYFNRELTGPEYAAEFEKMLKESGVRTMYSTTVISVEEDKKVTALNRADGLIEIFPKAIVLAMGCRERSSGAIGLAGSRPAGVYSAGMAQKLCNRRGYMVGKRVVILGSGDIGLIMARRMTYEGAKVLMVLELMDYSSGLKRNIVQCLDDYNIPLKLSYTVTRVVGEGRLEGVYIAPVDEKLNPITKEEEYIECDTLLLSVGLIPENDLIANLATIRPVTGGALVDDMRQTDMEGVFACGNALHVHDLVDNVSQESEIAGRSAAEYVLKGKNNAPKYKVEEGKGIKYVTPSFIHQSDTDKDVNLYMRVDKVYKNARLKIYCGQRQLLNKKKMIFTPGEMEVVKINAKDVSDNITVALEAEQ